MIDIRINDLPYLWSLAWRRHVGVYPDGHQPGARKPTEKTVTEFSTKAWIHLEEELISIETILFLIQWLFR